MARTNMIVFAENSATRPTGDGNTFIQSRRGYVEVDLHVHEDAHASFKKFDDFALLKVGPSEFQGVNVYLTPETIDQAVALRDAANAAIRHLRKLAKGA
jgi:hypothetical protein